MAIKHSLFRFLTLLFASVGVVSTLWLLVIHKDNMTAKRSLGTVALLSFMISFIVSGIWKYQTFLLASRYKIKDLQDERDMDMAEYIKYVYWTEIMWSITSAFFIGMFVYLITRLFKK